MQGVIRIFLGVGEKQGEIICDGFINPLVAVARPCDDVAPPLMCDLMVRNKFRKTLLGGGAQASTLLSFRTQKGIGGNIEQAGPTLPKGSGNLRNAEVVEWEGPAECLIKTDRGIDLFAELLEGIGRAGRGRRRERMPPRSGAVLRGSKGQV